MLVIKQRIMNGHEVVGYTVADEFGNVQNLRLEEVKAQAQAKQIVNVRISSGSLSGVNGFQLRELPVIQLNDTNKAPLGLSVVNKLVIGAGSMAVVLGYTLHNSTSASIGAGPIIIAPNQSGIVPKSQVAAMGAANVRLTNGKYVRGADGRSVYINPTDKVPSIQVGTQSPDGTVEFAPPYEVLRSELKSKAKLDVVAKLVYGDSGSLMQKNGVSPSPAVIGYTLKNNVGQSISIGSKVLDPGQQANIGRGEIPFLTGISLANGTINNNAKGRPYITTTNSVLSIQVGQEVSPGEWELLPAYGDLINEVPHKTKLTVVAKLVFGNSGEIMKTSGALSSSGKIVGYAIRNTTSNAVQVGATAIAPGAEAYIPKSDLGHIAAIGLANGKIHQSDPSQGYYIQTVNQVPSIQVGHEVRPGEWELASGFKVLSAEVSGHKAKQAKLTLNPNKKGVAGLMDMFSKK